MSARMSEKEWAKFTADKYLDPWTGAKVDKPDPAPSIDEYDWYRLMRTFKETRAIVERLQLIAIIGFVTLAILMVLTRV